MSDNEHESSSKSSYIPTFKGKKEDYEEWKMKIEAVLNDKNCDEALESAFKKDLPEDPTVLTEPDTPVNKALREAEEKAIKMNKKAMSVLTLALKGKDMMVIIRQAKTDKKYPKGKAYLVMEQLDKKYEPDDEFRIIEMQRELDKVKMKPNDDPADYFTLIKDIRNRYETANHPVDEKLLMQTALKGLPKDYIQTYMDTKKECKTTGETFDLLKLEDAMVDTFRLLEVTGVIKPSSKTKADDNEQEVLLMNSDADAKECYKCGRSGHRADKCPQRKCSFCNKLHKGPCWNHPKMKHRKDYLMKKFNEKHGRNGNKDNKGGNTTEHANTSVNVEGIDLLLTSLESVDLSALQFPDDARMLKHKNFFIGDTGATADQVNSDEGLINVRESYIKFMSSHGDTKDAVKKGDLIGLKTDKHGNVQQRIKIEGVNVNPNSPFNLISITKRLEQGWELGGDKNSIWISKGSNKLVFDHKISTKNGCVFGFYMEREVPEPAAVTVHDNERPVRTLTAQQAHDTFVHTNMDSVRATCKHLNWKITRGSLKPCESCGIGKAKKKNIPVHDEPLHHDDETRRMFLDLHTLKDKDGNILTMTNPHMCMKALAPMNLKLPTFHPTKNSMCEPTCSQLHRWKEAGHGITHLRMDNAGENKKLAKMMNGQQWKLDIEPEFTARDTPQENHLAEISITKANQGAVTLLHRANVPQVLRRKLFNSARDHFCFVDGFMVVELHGELKTRYEHAFGENPRALNHLRVFGEAGTVKLSTKTTPKYKERGT